MTQKEKKVLKVNPNDTIRSDFDDKEITGKKVKETMKTVQEKFPLSRIIKSYV